MNLLHQIQKGWAIVTRRLREQGLWVTLQWAFGRGLPTLTGGIVPTQYNALRPDVATAAPHPITNLAFKASTTRWHPARAPPLKA